MLLVLSLLPAVLDVPYGLPIILPSRIVPPYLCGDGDQLVAEVGRFGVKLNGERKSKKEIEVQLHQFYRTKVERILFVRGEPAVTYQEVVQFIDTANELVDYLVISLLTPSAEREPCLGVRIPEVPLAPWLKHYREHGTFSSH
ncbi:MAG: hypothetical protein JST93_05245 [Acidobacteria bacterium]|nr:hypothetical protein [Acidobacteriota bacterium]